MERAKERDKALSLVRKPPQGDAQPDFFAPSLYDVGGRDNRSVMDVAVFRLSKKDKRAGELIRYDLPDGYVEVSAGAHGMASIWDYDIVLMMVPTWADWLTQQAERGNAEALAVLRDREERTRRWNGELLTADRADKAKAVVLDKLKPKARKDGTMAYSTIDGGMVIDRKTHVQAQKATTGAALVALELASKRFEGQALIVEGTDEFRLEVAQLAGMHGLKVTFTDPAMERMRRETAEHKEMERAFQTEVYAPKDTKKGEASDMPGVAPQSRQMQPKDRSNGLI
ncbi:replication initiator protein A [Escherichia coli]|nr:replication initiator protein A [Escherichia coli]